MAEASKPLTARQAAFVREYAKLGNGTKAAEAAGFSPKNAHAQASRLLKKPHVKAALAAKLQAVEAKVEDETVQIVRELWHQAGYDPKDCFDKDGKLLPINEMPEKLRRAIGGFKFGKEGQLESVKFGSKLDALKLLGQRHKMWTEVVEHRVTLLDVLTAKDDAA